MRTLTKGLACSFGESQPSNTTVSNHIEPFANMTEDRANGQFDRLIAVASEPVACFEGAHNYVVPLALFGICCLYPAAMLTRPMFQALDQNLKITFDYSYLFVFAQIQVDGISIRPAGS